MNALIEGGYTSDFSLSIRMQAEKEQHASCAPCLRPLGGDHLTGIPWYWPHRHQADSQCQYPCYFGSADLYQGWSLSLVAWPSPASCKRVVLSCCPHMCIFKMLYLPNPPLYIRHCHQLIRPEFPNNLEDGIIPAVIIVDMHECTPLVFFQYFPRRHSATSDLPSL